MLTSILSYLFTTIERLDTSNISISISFNSNLFRFIICTINTSKKKNARHDEVTVYQDFQQEKKNIYAQYKGFFELYLYEREWNFDRGLIQILDVTKLLSFISEMRVYHENKTSTHTFFLQHATINLLINSGIHDLKL